MGLRGARFRGKVRIKGRPREQAKAEIMIMRAEEKREDKRRRRMFFTFLDLIILVAFGFSIYSVYISNYLNAIILVIIGALPLTYFIVRRILKNKEKRKGR